jgi:uncharacterized protein
MRFWQSLFVALVAVCCFASPSLAGGKIKVLIIDGQNNHNWEDTTPFLKAQLEKTGKFDVDVSTTPPPGSDKEKWDAWNPDLFKYQVVLSNYNGPAWPPHVQKNFEKFMREGGGLVNVHAANNAHSGWKEFEKMTGLLWRGNNHGFRVALNKEKETVRIDAGQGPGAGHGPQHSYEVLTVDQEHPITKGMPLRWQHTKDELYHGQRGPGENMNILAVSFSDQKFKGTGMYEPMVWWIPYGKGKAVTNVLGHVSRGDSKNMEGMRCVGFLTLVARSCEWAATGKVTIPVPENFPSADKTSAVGLGK